MSACKYIGFIQEIKISSYNIPENNTSLNFKFKYCTFFGGYQFYQISMLLLLSFSKTISDEFIIRSEKTETWIKMVITVRSHTIN